MAVRLKELESEIRELEEIADKAVLEVKAEYRQQINESVPEKRQKLQDKVRQTSKKPAEMPGKI